MTRSDAGGAEARPESNHPRALRRRLPHGSSASGDAHARAFILERIDVTDTGCWEWSRFRNPDGYGVTNYRGRCVAAHRLAHEAFLGPMPDGLYVLHSCDNPPCCNPTHLRAGTAADNARDRDERGRSNL